MSARRPVSYRVENHFSEPFEELGAEPARWREAFARERAGDWDRYEGAGFVVRAEGGERVASLLVVYVRARGWSLLWGREPAWGGGEWVSVGDPHRLDRWVQDARLATMPEGSFVNGPAAARRLLRFLADPLAPPEGEGWTDSRGLRWPEAV